MVNKWIGIGNLATDPDKRFTPAGKAVTNFRIGCNEGRGDKAHTEWVNVVCWEKTAEFVAEYLKKGAKVYVEGPMRTRKWQDKDGNDKYTTEIIAFTVQSLGSKNERVEEPVAHSYQTSGDNSVPF